MTKNGIVLSVVAVILAAVYIAFFTEWFRHRPITIVRQVRPGRPSGIPRPPNQPPVYPVSFAFDREYRFTSIKVVAAADLATNKSPAPLWHLISNTASAPTRSCLYGLPIKGMKPSKPRARAQSLLPDVQYILLVEAGRYKGRTNFWTREAVPLTGAGP